MRKTAPLGHARQCLLLAVSCGTGDGGHAPKAAIHGDDMV